ncbi:MAG: hypothetical protein DHS20C01_18540 [marine bacterium B5-7]|nr:MAG: hypothetical protein DHS20C01_18540 [marine bacterium B5-7]
MTTNLDTRPRKVIDGHECILYDGYWIRFYEPEDTYRARRDLLDALTRRTFHHSEPGINTPGIRLKQAREYYDREHDPDKKRVNAAMLAGALFNRATDIFTSVVEMEEKGISIQRDNELLRECGKCFREALELGAQVRHVSGEEGIDELWGEPLKVFTLSIKDYYESRYIKIAQALRTIDEVATRLIDVFSPLELFAGISERIDQYADVAKRYTEIMKNDPDFFAIWPEYVVTGDRLIEHLPRREDNADNLLNNEVFNRGSKLLREGKDLINYMSTVRVPMRKTTDIFLSSLDAFQTYLGDSRQGLDND